MPSDKAEYQLLVVVDINTKIYKYISAFITDASLRPQLTVAGAGGRGYVTWTSATRGAASRDTSPVSADRPTWRRRDVVIVPPLRSALFTLKVP